MRNLSGRNIGTLSMVPCQVCKKEFLERKSEINRKEKNHIANCCSKECRQKIIIERSKAKATKWLNQEWECNYCGKKFTGTRRIGRNKFCSSRCSASFNNNSVELTRNWPRRSSCEVILEELIREAFPEIKILICDRTLLEGLEVDIAIPEMKLAIEWNGIFHLKPIGGKEKFQRIKARDREKLLRARKKGVNLIVVADLISKPEFVRKIFDEEIRPLLTLGNKLD